MENDSPKMNPAKDAFTVLAKIFLIAPIILLLFAVLFFPKDWGSGFGTIILGFLVLPLLWVIGLIFAFAGRRAKG